MYYCIEIETTKQTVKPKAKIATSTQDTTHTHTTLIVICYYIIFIMLLILVCFFFLLAFFLSIATCKVILSLLYKYFNIFNILLK